LKGWAHPKKNQNLDFSAVSRDFEGTGSPKNIKTQTYPHFYWDFEGTDQPQKIANPPISLDREPGNCEVLKALTNCFSSLPLHPLETSVF
jgi:hypothetical protein